MRVLSQRPIVFIRAWPGTLQRVQGFLARPSLCFFCLAWLMVVLVVSTIAQRTIGLHEAQSRFLSSSHFWAGWIPLPGGAPVMALLFLGVSARLASRAAWVRAKLGVNLVHLGVLLLLGGGFLTARLGEEGSLWIPEGGSASYFSHYRESELAFVSPREGGTVAFSGEALQAGARLTHPGLAAQAEVLALFGNVEPRQRSTPLPPESGARGFAKVFELVELPLDPEAERNRAGIAFRVKGAGAEADGDYLLMEGMPIVQQLRAEQGTLGLELRRRRIPLPFRLELTRFHKEQHPGTEVASAYRSDLILHDGSIHQPVRVQMNEPFRYRGYTFYQASFTEGAAGNATVLAVVRNSGRWFPYLSGLLICLGLLVHLRQFLPRPLLLLLVALASSGAEAAPPDLDLSRFAAIPVQHEGRIKPLDSFARAHLLAFSGKESLEGITAIQWLAELLFDPETSSRRNVFRIPSPEALTALGLSGREGHRYSFSEIFPRLRAQSSLLLALGEREKVDRSPAQNMLVELDAKAGRFFELSRSFSFLVPAFRVESEPLARRLGLDPRANYSYSELLRVREPLRREARGGVARARELLAGLAAVEEWSVPEALRVLPPQFRLGALWASPWRLLQDGDGTPAVAAALAGWRRLAESYRSGDKPRFESAAAAVEAGAGLGRERWVRGGVVAAELAYHRWSLFGKAALLYGGTLLLLLFFRFRPRAVLIRLSGLLFSLALALHVLGIGMRMFVLARPPVATLYESVLFVALVAALLGLLLERRGRGRAAGFGLLTGSLAGSALLLLSFGLVGQGDSMSVLVAVLDTGFWLATHVVCMTIGYGACLVSSLFGHLYLLAEARGVSRERRNALFGSMLVVCGLALFFSATGTLLGGIWADQSWGRFWGWDPKENGALLVVLWLLFLLHGRVAGILRPAGFALGMVLLSVVVALAWFGVNLLGVGLHSYGFLDSTALPLLVFCVGEFLLGLILYCLARTRLSREGHA